MEKNGHNVIAVFGGATKSVVTLKEKILRVLFVKETEREERDFYLTKTLISLGIVVDFFNIEVLF